MFELSKFDNEIFFFHQKQVHLFQKTESFDNIDDFIQKILHPHLMELGPVFVKTYQGDPQSFLVLFSKTKNEEAVTLFERFGNDNKKKINFLLASEDT